MFRSNDSVPIESTTLRARPDDAPAPRESALTILRTYDFAAWATRDLTDAIADVIGHFLLSQQSVHTRRAYATDLREFLTFLTDNHIEITRVGEITERMLLGWQNALQSKHAAYAGSRRRVVQTSVARKLSAVSSLLQFARKRSLIDKNPAELLTRPRIRRESKTNAFTREEVRRVLVHCHARAAETRAGDARTHRSWALRHAVLSTLFSVGMRVDELCELRIGDLEVSPEFTRLHMTAKGAETHTPIIHADTSQLLQVYIGTFRAGAPNDAFLFLRAQKVGKETKLTQAAVYDMITSVAREVGIDKRVSPHSCRATLATLLHNGGVPIGHIQELLNHKQITTTAIYIKKAEALSEAAATKINILSDE